MSKNKGLIMYTHVKERLETEILFAELFEKFYKANSEKKAPWEVLEWMQENMENAAQEVCDEMGIDLF